MSSTRPVFVRSGAEAPVRDIAAEAGVGLGTIYRHFPTRADLVIAVHRHQVEACAEAGSALLASSATPHAALGQWIDHCVHPAARRAAASGEIRPDVEAFELMRGVGNLCIGADHDPRYDARRLVDLLIAGLRRGH